MSWNCTLLPTAVFFSLYGEANDRPGMEWTGWWSILGSVRAWLESPALPVKETTGNGGLGFSPQPSPRKIKPAYLIPWWASQHPSGENTDFGRTENTVQSLCLSLCSLLSQERDIHQFRQKNGLLWKCRVGNLLLPGSAPLTDAYFIHWQFIIKCRQ